MALHAPIPARAHTFPPSPSASQDLSSQQSEGVPPGIFQEPCCNSERSKSGVLERRGYGPMGRCLPVEPGLVWVQTGFGYQNYFFSRSYKVVIHTS